MRIGEGYAVFMDRARAQRIDPDQVVVLHGIPWEHYDGLCKAREHSAGPRMAYLDGVLEIMSPGTPHEFDKTLIARLLEAYAEERGLSLNGLGNTTYRSKAKRAGLEPDECYMLGRLKEVPEVAIEVVSTSGGIDKLEIYRRLGVREVWFWEDGFRLFHLSRGTYREVERSRVIPGIDLERIAQIVRNADWSRQTETVRAYRRSLRRRR